MGFLFVERILEIEPGRHARGRFTVPAGSAFPQGLVAEAVGQLAAWAAMAKMEFRRRPVAAIAGRARFHGSPPPGSSLELEARLESCDDSATTYAGSAHVGGQTILELERCLGPMLPMEDFDDPFVVGRRFERLCAGTEPRTAVEDVTNAGVLTSIAGDRGLSRRASLHVPTSAPFFADHFPRKPIFPGTLLLEAMLALAKDLANETLAAPPASLVVVRDVKLRRFLAPGDAITLAAALKASVAGRARIAVVATRGEERVAVSQAEISARGAS